MLHPDTVFVAVTVGKLTSNGISITGRGFGAAASSLNELYAKFVRGTRPIPPSQPTGLLASTSTVKRIAKVFSPRPFPRVNSRLFALVACIQGEFGIVAPERFNQLNDALGVTPSFVLKSTPLL